VRKPQCVDDPSKNQPTTLPGREAPASAPQTPSHEITITKTPQCDLGLQRQAVCRYISSWHRVSCHIHDGEAVIAGKSVSDNPSRIGRLTLVPLKTCNSCHQKPVCVDLIKGQ
jgi:hypothetical protein